jgi:hypothetical protein
MMPIHDTPLHHFSRILDMHQPPLRFPIYPMGLTSPMFNVMPPLRSHTGPGALHPMAVALSPAVFADGAFNDGKFDIKERNRVAAQKWREKKDQYLLELESSHDVLRKQALELNTELQLLRMENSLLEGELIYFQSFMSKMMGGAK